MREETAIRQQLEPGLLVVAVAQEALVVTQIRPLQLPAMGELERLSRFSR